MASASRRSSTTRTRRVRLDPGASRAYPTVSLLAHGGDGHAAFNADSQSPTSEKLCWLEARIPAIISPERKRFFVDETFTADSQSPIRAAIPRSRAGPGSLL